MNLKGRIVEAAAAVKDVRCYLNGVFITKLKHKGSKRPARTAMVATDGHCLAVVFPEDGDEYDGPHDVIVPTEAFKEARRLNKTKPEIKVGKTHTELANGARFENIDGRYPQFDRVIPRQRRKEVSVCFNPDLLVKMKKALCEKRLRGEEGLKLYFPVICDDDGHITGIDPHGTIRVFPHDSKLTDSFGIIMPMRADFED